MGDGKMIRAYQVQCITCRRIGTYTQGDHIVKATAERIARQHGWTKTKRGWQCNLCKLDADDRRARAAELKKYL